MVPDDIAQRETKYPQHTHVQLMLRNLCEQEVNGRISSNGTSRVIEHGTTYHPFNLAWIKKKKRWLCVTGSKRKCDGSKLRCTRWSLSDISLVSLEHTSKATLQQCQLRHAPKRLLLYANTGPQLTNVLGDKRGEGLAKECLCLTFGNDPQREGKREREVDQCTSFVHDCVLKTLSTHGIIWRLSCKRCQKKLWL